MENVPQISSLNALQQALNVDTEPEGSLIRNLVQETDNLNYLTARGSSALHIAVVRNYFNSSRILLEAGASPNLRGMDNTTPIFLCGYFHRKFGHGNEILRLLLQYGANVNAVDDRKYTPLIEASIRNIAENILDLLKHGATVNAVDDLGKTPLFHVLNAYRAEVSTVQALLQAGADVNLRCNEGVSPLHNAAERNDVEIVRLLLAHKAEINVCDNLGETPLHYSVSGVDTHWEFEDEVDYPIKTIRELLKAGALLNAPNKYGQSPLIRSLGRLILGRTQELLRAGAIFKFSDVEKAVKRRYYGIRDIHVPEPIIQELIRYTFINNSDSLESIRQQLMESSVNRFFRWAGFECNMKKFKDACLDEADAMSKIICDCGSSSVWDSMLEHQACACDSNYAILKYVLSGRPSHFGDAFFYKLSKNFLLEVVVNQLSFFEFKDSKKRIMLHWPCLKVIERYVSFEELVCFLQRKESVMPDSEFYKFLAFTRGESLGESSNEIRPLRPKRL